MGLRAWMMLVLATVLTVACSNVANDSQQTWSKDGKAVSTDVLQTLPGCQAGDDFRFLVMGWPIGTHALRAEQHRYYVRDPRGLVKFSELVPFDAHAKLSPDAVFTGYSSGAIRLFLAPSDQDRVAYVVLSSTAAEAWPRSDPPALCV